MDWERRARLASLEARPRHVAVRWQTRPDVTEWNGMERNEIAHHLLPLVGRPLDLVNPPSVDPSTLYQAYLPPYAQVNAPIEASYPSKLKDRLERLYGRT